MATALPARANLDYLKKVCKERVKALRAGGKEARLAGVQRELAREHGFGSWGKLRAAVMVRESGGAIPREPSDGNAGAAKEEGMDAFLELAVEATDLRARGAAAARAMLAERPGLRAGNIYAAAATGSSEGVWEWLQKDPGLAMAAGGVRGWVPLLYLCYSLLLREEKSKSRRGEFGTCARLLVEAGADVNVFFACTAAGWEGTKESALYGACGRANCAKVTKVLLEAGADVNDGETMYHVAEHAEHTCLRMVLERKPVDMNYCFCHALDHEDPAGARIFLEFGADANWMIERGAGDIRGLRPLHFAILRGRSVAVIRELVKGGADVRLTSAAGLTPYAYAARLGRVKVAEYLAKQGGRVELSEREQFLADCVAGRAQEARRRATLVQTLTPHEMATMTVAAGLGRLSAVKLMVELGFDLEAVGAGGGTALHQAAWEGRWQVVRFLLARGARVDVKQQWGGDALQTAVHSWIHNGENKHGAEIVRLIAGRMTKVDWAGYIDKALKEGAERIVPVLEGWMRSASDDPAIAALPPHRRTHKIAGWKPLMDAAFAGDAARVKKLLAQGHDPNVVSTTPARYRPLHRAMEFKKTAPRGERHVEAVRALLEGGANPHLRGGWEMLTALGQAGIGEVQFVEVLRPRFVPLDLFHAALLGEEDRVAAVLRGDRKLATAKDENGWTALHYAAASGYFDARKKEALLAIARRLIDAGADPSATYRFNDEWPIPVMYGCAGRHDFPEMTELLIQAGASACDGESVYHAADEGHEASLAVIERLTDRTALAKECTWALPTMLHWGHTGGMKWLLAHGADPNALAEKWGNSALHEAALRGSAEKVIGLLLKSGGDPKRKNKMGKTAVELAREAGRERVVRQLMG